MKILPTGDLEVAPKETITVTVVKSQRPYAAAISDLIGAVWETTQKPNDLTEERTFRAPTSKASEVFCAIVFDFSPNDQGAFDPGDKYTVTMKGNSAEATRIATVVPPPIVSLTFTFVIRG